MNREYAARHPGDTVLDARVRSYELAGRMQSSVPEATEIAGESAATRALYGMDSPVTEAFGRNCLRARRLLERGVRFVQLYHGGAFGSPRINWDGHEDVEENHRTQAASLDKPVAGLLKDLKSRGMLDDTLVLWTTEFGRTPVHPGRRRQGPRPPPAGLHLLDGRRRPEARFRAREDGRTRLPGRRGQDERL